MVLITASAVSSSVTNNLVVTPNSNCTFQLEYKISDASDINGKRLFEIILAKDVKGIKQGSVTEYGSTPIYKVTQTELTCFNNNTITNVDQNVSFWLSKTGYAATTANIYAPEKFSCVGSATLKMNAVLGKNTDLNSPNSFPCYSGLYPFDNFDNEIGFNFGLENNIIEVNQNWLPGDDNIGEFSTFDNSFKNQTTFNSSKSQLDWAKVQVKGTRDVALIILFIIIIILSSLVFIIFYYDKRKKKGINDAILGIPGALPLAGNIIFTIFLQPSNDVPLRYNLFYIAAAFFYFIAIILYIYLNREKLKEFVNSVKKIKEN